MAIKRYKPTSAARRFMTVHTYEEITETKPEKDEAYVPRKRSDAPRPAPRKIEKAKDLDAYFAKLKEFSSNNQQ